MGMETKALYRVVCNGCERIPVGSGYVSSDDLAHDVAVAAGFEDEVVDGVVCWYCPDCLARIAPVIQATVDKELFDELLRAAGDVVLMLDFGVPLSTVQMRSPHWDKIYALRAAIEKVKTSVHTI